MRSQNRVDRVLEELKRRRADQGLVVDEERRRAAKAMCQGIVQIALDGRRVSMGVETLAERRRI